MAVTLQAGDKAPLFSGKNQNGETVKLKDYLGKKVVLYFYPKDATPTCTVQACNLRDNFAALKQAGIAVIGISPDDVKSHKKFEEKQQLPFPLIADDTHTILNKYGVWDKKKLYGREYMGVHRTTFLIDEKGKIAHVFLKPKSANHAQEILAVWEAQ